MKSLYEIDLGCGRFVDGRMERLEGRFSREHVWMAEVVRLGQGCPVIIFNKSKLVMMPTGSFPCVTTNR